jgi:hypothetical protein
MKAVGFVHNDASFAELRLECRFAVSQVIAESEDPQAAFDLITRMPDLFLDALLHHVYVAIERRGRTPRAPRWAIEQLQGRPNTGT